MKQFSFLFCLVLLAVSCLAQDNHRPKRMTLKLKVMDSIPRVEYGYLAAISYKPANCREAIICFDLGPGPDAAAGASVGTVVGAAVGGIIGALAKKTWTIGAKKNRFNEMKPDVIEMTYSTK